MEQEAALRQVELRIAEIIGHSDPLVLHYADSFSQGHGKLLRPRLLLAMAALFGCNNPSLVIECAACCELLHTATLMHDDVIDDADTRRGQPSLNSRHGNEVAVVVGDYILALVFQSLARLRLFPVLDMVLATSQELGLGVLAEALHRNDLRLAEEEYFRIIYRKTAALFELCCGLGAFLGTAEAAGLGLAQDYGRALGLGFQVIDDVLDIAGDEQQTGKPSFSDLREGRVTLPLIYAHAREPERTSQLAAQFQLKPAGTAQQEMRQHLLRLGSLQHAGSVAGQYLRQARQTANELARIVPSPDALAELVQIEHKVLATLPIPLSQTVAT